MEFTFYLECTGYGMLGHDSNARMQRGFDGVLSTPQSIRSQDPSMGAVISIFLSGNWIEKLLNGCLI